MSSFRRKNFHKWPVRKDEEEETSETKPVKEEPEDDSVPPSLEPLNASEVTVPASQKKKTKQKHKKKASVAHAVHTEQAKTVAAETLKMALRKRLHARIRMKSTSRAGGTSQDVQNILQKFNDGDDEKADMMKEIQKDVQGMRQKDAKKYLSKVLGTMGSTEADTFVDMVKDKVPSNQSNEIVNYVKRHRKIRENEDTKKPQVNPESVYVPTRLLSEEAKAERLMQPQPPQQKKKKTFGRVNVQVPKLAELRNHPGLESSSELPPPPTRSKTDKSEQQNKKKKKAFGASAGPKVVDMTATQQAASPVPGVPLPKRTGERAHDIDRLFPDLSQHSREEQEAARLTYFQRIKNVTTFEASKMSDHMRKFLFEASELVELLWIREVEFLSVPEAMEVPGTEQTVTDTDLPEDVRLQLASQDIRVVLDVSKNWIYKRIFLPDTSPVLVKIRNAYPECAQFLLRFDHIKAWLESLKGQKVPWQWLCEMMNDMGVLRQKQPSDTTDRQKTWSEYFRVLCHEYRSETKKLSVPIVPFVKLTLSC